MRALRKFLLPAAALIAAFAGYFTAHLFRETPTEPAVPQSVEFRLPDLDGKMRSSAEWRGRPVLVNFWATWCPPCREEIPLFLTARERYASQGLEIIGIAVDEADAVLAYSESIGITYPVLIGDDQVLGYMGKLGNPSGGLPYSVLVSSKGEIVDRKTGGFTEAELQQFIQPILRMSGATQPATSQ